MSKWQYTCTRTRQLLCLIIHKNILVLCRCSGLSAVISHFKPPIYLHEIWNRLECQRGNQHCLTLVLQRGERPCWIGGPSDLLAQAGASVLGGPGWPWADSLSGFSCGPALKPNKSSIYATTHKAGPWARITGLACQLLFSPDAALGYTSAFRNWGNVSRGGTERKGMLCQVWKQSRKCCLLAMKWR